MKVRGYLSGSEDIVDVLPGPDSVATLRYILDTGRLADEVIVKEGATCLTRADFWTLGLRREMESDIGNACMRLIYEEARAHGKDVYIADMYIVATWKSGKDPLTYFPENADMKDALVFPAWTQATGPDHYLLCEYCTSSRPWTEATGLDIGVLPQQTNSNDCGVFVLMYALNTVLDIPFNFSQVRIFLFFFSLKIAMKLKFYCWSLDTNNKT
ncbi:uncharacterized protein [Garra rufa]|uniref:uncharacterized protein n=1 Tax=Garra rufa TaxID=137080 RepID=UPI003CCEB710